jgi:hypothetical protein
MYDHYIDASSVATSKMVAKNPMIVTEFLENLPRIDLNSFARDLYAVSSLST